jgi:hypothetical protein
LTNPKGGYLPATSTSEESGKNNQDNTFVNNPNEPKIVWDPPPPLPNPDFDDHEEDNPELEDQHQRCKECGSLDVSAKFLDMYSLLVCKVCIKAKPDQYSLLTKTEVKQDYLLTESELKELKCWTKPNPLSKTYSNMLLYARCQVEDFAKEAQVQKEIPRAPKKDAFTGIVGCEDIFFTSQKRLGSRAHLG